MSKRETRIGLRYAVGGKLGCFLEDALYRIVRGISETTFYECFHEWSFEEIVNEMTIQIEKGSDNYDYTIYGYIDTNSYIGDSGYKKWGEGSYQCRIINGQRIYVPSKDFKDFYNECLERQTRTISDGEFVCIPAYDAILSFFKNMTCKCLEDEITMYDAITNAAKKVLCGKEKEVVIKGGNELPRKDPFFH